MIRWMTPWINFCNFIQRIQLSVHHLEPAMKRLAFQLVSNVLLLSVSDSTCMSIFDLTFVTCKSIWKEGDINFQSQRRSISQIASENGVKVWAYYFTQPTPNTSPWLGGNISYYFVRVKCLTPWLVAHSTEVPFVYGPPSDTSASAVALSDAILDYWVSFATSLDPNDGKGSKSM